MISTVNQSQCPLCQQNNLCGVNDKEACWCVSSSIKRELLALVPKELSGKSCVCQQCIDKFNAVEIVDRS
jgi:hypothetical protein